MNDQAVNKSDGDQELTPLAGTELEPSSVPQRVLIVPWGEVESSNGAFIVDAEAGRLVIEAFEAHGTDLPIDYEHQTLGGQFTSPTGQAPAAGWIKRVNVEEGVGLTAEVVWTAPALEQLAARQYRYLSPVALVRKSDRRMAALHSAALTNKPAIVGMAPIVNRAGDAVAPAPAPQSALEDLRCRLSLEPACGADEVLVAARDRLTALDREARQHDATARVEEAARRGKLVPAQRDWAVRLAMRDQTLFDEWLRTAPVVVVPGRTPTIQRTGDPTGRAVAVAHGARAEFRASSLLTAVTSEEAFVAQALRERGVGANGRRPSAN